VQCWNCKTETVPGALSCPRCGKVQPGHPGATYFEAFGLKPTVDVDVPGLEREYRERSLQVHPDRFSTAQARERRFALEQSTLLNDAYRTLKDRASRAFYLLKLNGVDLSREDAGTQNDMPLSFLEEVMELREALDGHRESGRLEAALEMAGDVSVRRSDALAEADASLRQLLARRDEDASRRGASHALARVRYFTRFLEEVNAMEEEALEG
jgi:molecular chaperone HscB